MEPALFFRTESARTLLLSTFQFRFRRCKIVQPFLPLRFQSACYQPVLRLHGAILALSSLSLVARTLDSKPPLAERGIVIGFQLPNSLFGSFYCSWRQRLQKGFRHRLVDLDGTDGEAVNASSLDDIFA